MAFVVLEFDMDEHNSLEFREVHGTGFDSRKQQAIDDVPGLNNIHILKPILLILPVPICRISADSTFFSINLFTPNNSRNPGHC